MRSRIVDRPLALLGAVVLASLVGASPLAAQCITGPAYTCGGAITLCGPEGTWAYEWSGPGGFSSADRCVLVYMPGTYTLNLFDPQSGASQVCTHELASGVTPFAWITGPTEGPSCGTVDLCGPPGDFTYAWTFPDGATASTACVTVSQSGTYTLRVADRASGCAGWPVSHTVTFPPCIGDPPPPPPPATSVSCPLTASFWAAQCRGGYEGRNARRLDPVALGSLAACVDERSALFAWDDPREGLCAALRVRSHSDLRARTRRQYAAVLANVCAGSAGLVTARGAAIGLDPGQRLTLDGAPPTLGEWIASADQQLVTLEASRLADREVTSAYRAILRTAWLINHGQGLETVCPRPEGATARATGGAGPDEEVALEPDDRSLAMVMAGDESAVLQLEPAWPNPFRGETRFAYALPGSEPAAVRVTVVDLAGRAVRVLADGMAAPGRHELTWDGRDASGRMLPGGVYFVNASVGGRRIQSRLTLLR